MDKYKDILFKVKEYLKQCADINFYEEYIADLHEIYKVVDNKIYVITQSFAHKSRLEQLLGGTIDKYLRERDYDVVIKFITEEMIQEEVTAQNLEKPLVNNKYSQFNKLYTFDNFVIGKSNRLVFNASLKVADQPGVFANPLYIFGDVGLGKTHIMQAIGNYIIENDMTKNVVYVKAQSFIDDYKNAVNKKDSSLKELYDDKYYNADVLLVDDIQMLAKKELTQEAFFQVFEKLYSENKQIVITSDRPARELRGIMDRLTSRFSMGFVFDIGLPDLETRIEILNKKAKMQFVSSEIDNTVLEFIATHFNKSVRDLEGALNRVLFYSVELYNGEITMEGAKEALSIMTNSKEKIENIVNLNADLVEKTFEIVCDYYNVNKTEVLSNSRKNTVIYPRQLIMYILRNKYNLEYTKIGDIFNGKKHTTVMNAVDKIIQLRKSDKSFDSLVDSIYKKI